MNPVETISSIQDEICQLQQHVLLIENKILQKRIEMARLLDSILGRPSEATPAPLRPTMAERRRRKTPTVFEMVQMAALSVGGDYDRLRLATLNQFPQFAEKIETHFSDTYKVLVFTGRIVKAA